MAEGGVIGGGKLDAREENRIRHLVSLSCSKVADGLADAKLVLAWLIGALGAPGWMLGLLVPIREAGALLPQILLAPHVAATRHRKWWWAAGSLVQGLAALGIALVALIGPGTLSGATAGALVLGLLAIAALARSACSVSYKDVLGKTVEKGARGGVTGRASSIAAGAVLVFAALLILDIVSRTTGTIGIALGLAALAWFSAAAVFSGLDEEVSEGTSADTSLSGVLAQFRHLARDRQLGAFIAVRGCLTATALAPPFLLAAAGQAGDGGLGALGPFLLASATAALVSGWFWGQLSDLSSRSVLAAAGGIAGVLLLAAALGGGWLAGSPALGAAALFVLLVAHQGVRSGRSTHLVDMAPEDHRAAYTAVSNTLIGVILLGGGAVGWLADRFGTDAALATFGMLALMGAAGARLFLRDVQSE